MADDDDPIVSASSLAELGNLVLSTSDPLTKSKLSHLAYTRWRRQSLPLGVATPPDQPARPLKPHLKGRMTEASSSSTLANSNILCSCGKGHYVIKTSKTEKNPGRDFFRCPHWKDSKDCGFFLWIDEYKMCPCNRGPCKVLTSKKRGSIGQRFYACTVSKLEDHGCGYFSWVEKNPEDATPDPAKPADPKCHDMSTLQRVESIKRMLEVEVEASERVVNLGRKILDKLDGLSLNDK